MNEIYKNKKLATFGLILVLVGTITAAIGGFIWNRYSGKVNAERFQETIRKTDTIISKVDTVHQKLRDQTSGNTKPLQKKIAEIAKKEIVPQDYVHNGVILNEGLELVEKYIADLGLNEITFRVLTNKDKNGYVQSIEINFSQEPSFVFRITTGKNLNKNIHIVYSSFPDFDTKNITRNDLSLTDVPFYLRAWINDEINTYLSEKKLTKLRVAK